ncbi:MAG TPA: DUF1987 domain-containing protein [Tenuifilaceae bacterium]|nr:DUF1987 domain-containing protein [Tenuifilaceae bacterium]HPE18053.1 DUF1987 domain-containing protein [Tenuifilaceae bacterium]HPJ44584.1 DUF1987 domain-containing protein [Tenuifilaceae bacterium]HPQ34464.1 DUF1987 domain-containing protein [Tenuifilaceae bacterium]HRX68775.1 DUF1987 domain-containing protein [Tenuifilaceae bacterium]
MDIINIPESEITPHIELNKEQGIFIIEGKSLPEDVKDFYNPVIEWFNQYQKEPNEETHFILDFEYFNTASSKMILILLSKLRDVQKMGKRVFVTWKFPQYDVELEEAGEEFSELLNIPFTFIPKVQ